MVARGGSLVTVNARDWLEREDKRALLCILRTRLGSTTGMHFRTLRSVVLRMSGLSCHRTATVGLRLIDYTPPALNIRQDARAKRGRTKRYFKDVATTMDGYIPGLKGIALYTYTCHSKGSVIGSVFAVVYEYLRSTGFDELPIAGRALFPAHIV